YHLVGSGDRERQRSNAGAGGGPSRGRRKRDSGSRGGTLPRFGAGVSPFDKLAAGTRRPHPRSLRGVARFSRAKLVAAQDDGRVVALAIGRARLSASGLD